MKIVARLSKVLLSAALIGTIGYGMVAVLTPTASAGPGGPLCGFTSLWDCTLPDGSHRTVAGTACDISRYQKATGAHCVPSGL